MKRVTKHTCAAVIITIALLSVTSGAFALVPAYPQLDWQDGYSYDDGTDTLTINNSYVNQVWYLDETSSVSDNIQWASVVFPMLTNSSGGLSFDAPAGDNFYIGAFGGAINDAYLTAHIDQFDITNSCSGSSGCVNEFWDIINLTNVSINNTIGSTYLSELQSQLNSGYDLAISVNFAGPANFTGNESGTANGKMVVVPEPVSTVLFLTGGTVLAGMRIVRGRRNLFS